MVLSPRALAGRHSTAPIPPRPLRAAAACSSDRGEIEDGSPEKGNMCRGRDDGGHIRHGDWAFSTAAGMDWLPTGKRTGRLLPHTQTENLKNKSNNQTTRGSTLSMGAFVSCRWYAGCCCCCCHSCYCCGRLWNAVLLHRAKPHSLTATVKV